MTQCDIILFLHCMTKFLLYSLLYSVKVGILSQPAWPLPERWDSQKGKNVNFAFGNPCHIATKSQHLWAVPRQIKFWSILKKVGIGSDPRPPSLDQIPNFYRKFVSGASLTLFTLHWEAHGRRCPKIIDSETSLKRWNIFLIFSPRLNSFVQTFPELPKPAFWCGVT